MNTVPTPQDYAQSHRGQFANTRQNPNSFPFTPLTKCWTSSLVHEIALHIFRRVVFSTVNVITTSIFYEHTKGNLIQRKQLHYLDSPSFLFSRSTDTFCSDCSCHKTVSLLAITLLSLSLMDADTVTAEGPELGMNSNALSREHRMAGYLCSLINLQAISRISISVLSYDVDVRSGQERKAWGRREICCLIPSRQSWRSPYKLNESSWRDQKQSEPENSNKKSYELSSKKKKKSSNLLLKEKESSEIQNNFCSQSHMHKPNIISTVTTWLWNNSRRTSLSLQRDDAGVTGPAGEQYQLSDHFLNSLCSLAQKCLNSTQLPEWKSYENRFLLHRTFPRKI